MNIDEYLENKEKLIICEKQKEPVEILFRYNEECGNLASLAWTQLNSDKNKVKPPIEDMEFTEIMCHIFSELQELENELTETKGYHVKDRPTINKQRVREELGDVIALCAGLLAKIEKDVN